MYHLLNVSNCMHDDILFMIYVRGFFVYLYQNLPLHIACKRRNTLNNNKKETVEERCGLASVLHEKNQFYTLTICIMSRGGVERKQAEYTVHT
jgi:hypothetical protein